ncbi:hypothetical protein HYDPIDRAFT_34656 [Hydnomerulius pinastri MD-312]|uniref:Uncharacterized protein n=1 Tax=Hydnomerulius pinastri MD-312 TaxID=994086 RepID=A0A0C9W6R9_9AGAM|nr:hypothetical protein HYDPIDRAFT_34656 [Hydnomerulius pinastri MD-312]
MSNSSEEKSSFVVTPPSGSDPLPSSSPPSSESKPTEHHNTTYIQSQVPRHSHKRTRLQFSLPSEEPPQSKPRKKAKILMTTVSVPRSREVEDLHSLRMLQLARATRDALKAHKTYHRLRIRELDVMRTIAVDELEEAHTLFQQAEKQIGEVRHVLNENGADLSAKSARLFAGRREPTNGSDDNLSDLSGSGSGSEASISPSPSLEPSSSPTPNLPVAMTGAL